MPRKLAFTAPKASSAVLVFGVPIRLPTIRMPPATTNSENSRMMNGMYSSNTVCRSACAAAPGPSRAAAGRRKASVQNRATLSKWRPQKSAANSGNSAIDISMPTNGIAQA